jgi:hypothetical protein
MQSRITSCLLVVLPLISLANLARVRGEDDKATQILQRCSAALLKIKSLECDCSVIRKQEKTEEVEARRSGEAIRLIIQGSKFRLDYYDNLASPAGKPDFIYTYNGEKVFDYRPKSNNLGFKTKATVFTPGPFTFYSAFSWVYVPNEGHSWNNLISQDTWDAAAKRARSIGTVQEQETTYEVLEFDLTTDLDRKQTYRVYFAPRLDYFPLKWELTEGGKMIAKATTTRHAKVKLGDRILVVPLEVEDRTYAHALERASVTDYYLAEDSLRLNPEIDEKVFTLSADGVSVVNDRDKMP